MEQLDDLLAGVDVTLTDDILDRIDEIVPPGTDVGTLDQAYRPRRCWTRPCAAAPPRPLRRLTSGRQGTGERTVGILDHRPFVLPDPAGLQPPLR